MCKHVAAALYGIGARLDEVESSAEVGCSSGRDLENLCPDIKNPAGAGLRWWRSTAAKGDVIDLDGRGRDRPVRI